MKTALAALVAACLAAGTGTAGAVLEPTEPEAPSEGA